MELRITTLMIACIAMCNAAIGSKPGDKPAFSVANALGNGGKKAPLGFEENKGQFEDEKGNRVDNYFYRFKANDADIYLGENGISYLLFKQAGEHKPHKKGEHSHDSILYSRVDMDLVGANIRKENIVAEDELDFSYNYYTGASRINDVKQFQKLTFRDIYRGIDWVWRVDETQNGGLIKYDFVVHPNADASQIKMLYKWADVQIQNGNSVHIKTPLREINEGEAISYVNGAQIKTSYIVSENTVSYQLENYDHSQTLTIDPPLNILWGTYYGGNWWEKNTDVSNAVDNNNNVFVVGNTFSSSNIPLVNPGGGAYFQGTYAGGSGIEGHGGDIVIFKFTPGGALVWCTYVGGSDQDNGVSITVDQNTNNVYVSGCSLSSNFPLQNLAGAYNQSTYAGGSNSNDEGGDAVIMKFSNNGNMLWSTFYGGAGNDNGRGIVTDAAGNVFMVGWTSSTNFPVLNPGGGAYYQSINGGSIDAFVVKFNSAGAQVWSTYYGGGNDDIAHYISRDLAAGMVFVGETASSNFPVQNPGGGAYYQAANSGTLDAFIVKINLAGVRSWGTYYGGSGADVARGVNVQVSGAIYMVGQTASTNFPLANPGSGAYYQPSNAGASDIFMVRFTNPGAQVWSTYFGGSQDDDGCAVVTDACGNIYTTGNTYSTDFPTVDPGNNAFYSSVNQAMDDPWFAAFQPNNTLLWSTYCGSQGFDEKGTSLKIDNLGHLYIVGYWCFYSTSVGVFNLAGAYNKTNVDADDFFIAKFDLASCTNNPINFNLCYGSNAILTMNNIYNLANPSYSIMPGATVQASPNFTVSPPANITYTMYITGLNSSSVMVTYSTIANGTVFPAPVANLQLQQGTCANPSNSVNIGVTFQPSGSPNYTTTWSTPLPSSFSSVNSATAAGLVPGPNSATITTQNGCMTIVNFTMNPTPLPADFIVINPSNDYTITCNNPNVLLTTSVTNGNILSFVWSPCSPTVTGPSYNFTTPCVGQVVGTTSTGCQMVKTFTVYQNMQSPTVAVTPTIMNITCNAAPGTFTGTSNLGPNVTTNWFQIVGTNTVYVGTPQGTINIFAPGQPGTFWFESVYNITGCRSTRSVQVTASLGVPVFTVTSSTNFTIGCASKSVTSLQVTSVVTSPVPSVAVNYTFMTPPVSSTPTTFSAQPNLNGITVPGVYVVWVQDQTNNCVASQSINIIQNIIPPNIGFIQPLSILTCRDASMVLTGISSNTNTQITWTVPSLPSPSVNPTPNATVYINPAITGGTNVITALGVWTVGAIDNNNFCTSSQTVQILQDVRVPKFTITAQSNSVINCNNPDVVIVPVVTSSLAVALVPQYFWYPPVGSPIGGSSFNTSVPGSHTCISTSVVNGCTYVATYDVATDLIAPSLTPSTQFTIDCATTPSVKIYPTITGTTTGFTYTWFAPPGALVSSLTGSALTTNYAGDYHVIVTNTINGCKSTVGIAVLDGTIKALFDASPTSGFAPLSVRFINNSSTSTNSNNISSTWSFGNGQVYTNISNSVLASSTYSASGTYSVVLFVKKGACVASTMQLITVEIPSKIEVPNVFTPNSDGANDVFRLRASSLEEVDVKIFDRWGNLVYDVISDTGNFAWDGKAMTGKVCPAGTYFYVIKAKGKDAKEYEQKGNVSLFR